MVDLVDSPSVLRIPLGLLALDRRRIALSDQSLDERIRVKERALRRGRGCIETVLVSTIKGADHWTANGITIATVRYLVLTNHEFVIASHRAGARQLEVRALPDDATERQAVFEYADSLRNERLTSYERAKLIQTLRAHLTSEEVAEEFPSFSIRLMDQCLRALSLLPAAVTELWAQNHAATPWRVIRALSELRDDARAAACVRLVERAKGSEPAADSDERESDGDETDAGVTEHDNVDELGPEAEPSSGAHAVPEARRQRHRLRGRAVHLANAVELELRAIEGRPSDNDAAHFLGMGWSVAALLDPDPRSLVPHLRLRSPFGPGARPTQIQTKNARRLVQRFRRLAAALGDPGLPGGG